MTDSNVHEFKPRVVEEKPSAPTTIDEDLEALVAKARKTQRDLDEATRELETAQADLAVMTDAYETLSASQEAMEPVLELFDEIHRDAGHAGPWSFCADRLCRRLESWVHDRQKDLA